MSGTTVEFLAEELKKLVGWGADPKRLPYLPTIRSLAKVDERASLVTMGHLIRRYLIGEIDSLESSEFMGRLVEADKLNRAFKLLLMIEGQGTSAVNRRGRAIMVLGQYFSVEAWRRPDGAERSLLVILAESMVSRSAELQTSILVP